MNIELTDDLFADLPISPSRTHHFFKRIFVRFYKTMPEADFLEAVMELFMTHPLTSPGTDRGSSVIETRYLYLRSIKRLYAKYSLNQFFNECAVYMVSMTREIV